MTQWERGKGYSVTRDGQGIQCDTVGWGRDTVRHWMGRGFSVTQWERGNGYSATRCIHNTGVRHVCTDLIGCTQH